MAEKNKLIEGRTGPWEMVLGLEVHAQVVSNAKLFQRRGGWDSAPGPTSRSRWWTPPCRACCR